MTIETRPTTISRPSCSSRRDRSATVDDSLLCFAKYLQLATTHNVDITMRTDWAATSSTMIMCPTSRRAYASFQLCIHDLQQDGRENEQRLRPCSAVWQDAAKRPAHRLQDMTHKAILLIPLVSKVANTLNAIDWLHWSQAYEGRLCESLNTFISLQILWTGCAIIPHIKAMYVPFQMPYDSLVCPYRLLSDRPKCGRWLVNPRWTPKYGHKIPIS